MSIRKGSVWHRHQRQGAARAVAAVMTAIASTLHLRPVLIAPMTVIAVTIVELSL